VHTCWCPVPPYAAPGGAIVRTTGKRALQGVKCPVKPSFSASRTLPHGDLHRDVRDRAIRFTPTIQSRPWSSVADRNACSSSTESADNCTAMLPKVSSRQ
jgi:hypothetical protein